MELAPDFDNVLQSVSGDGLWIPPFNASFCHRTSITGSRLNLSNSALAAARDKASPPKVEEKDFLHLHHNLTPPDDSGDRHAVAQRLAKAEMSGVTPKYSCAPPERNESP